MYEYFLLFCISCICMHFLYKFFSKHINIRNLFISRFMNTIYSFTTKLIESQRNFSQNKYIYDFSFPPFLFSIPFKHDLSSSREFEREWKNELIKIVHAGLERNENVISRVYQTLFGFTPKWVGESIDVSSFQCASFSTKFPHRVNYVCLPVNLIAG